MEGPRPCGRLKRTWREVVQNDCQAHKFNRADAVYCSTHTHNRFTAGLEYVRVHPGQQVPER